MGGLKTQSFEVSSLKKLKGCDETKNLGLGRTDISVSLAASDELWRSILGG
jgi:hypothetical protein